MQYLVEILLATYNGKNYLEEQVYSLLNQTYPHISILIRDDGSTDGTSLLIDQLVQKYPQKIQRIPNQKNLGVKGNFSELMHASHANYIMFCDQDDVWDQDKVEKSIKALKKLESEWSSNTPLLIHTDLKVVNAKLNLISHSFWKYTKIDSYAITLNRILAQNCVTGCTMIINKSLLNLSKAIPKDAIMHDWWIALIATLFGKIDIVPTATISYRQHGNNDVGAKKYGLATFLKKKRNVERSILQAACLLEKYENQIDEHQKDMLKVFSTLNKQSYIEQKKNMIKYRFFKSGFLRNALFILAPH